MSLRREVWLALWLQGGGAASVLLAALLLGKVFGPEVQGGFSRVKAEIEFIAAFALFGLPQALFFHVKKGGLDLRSALRWAWRSVWLALPIAAGYAAVTTAERTHLAPFWMGLAVAACVAHGQFRALLLVREHAGWFSVLTAAPQVIVLVGVVGVVLLDGAGLRPSIAVWCSLFAIAYAVAAAAARRRLPVPTTGAVPDAAGWRELGHFGLAAWLAAALPAAAVVAVQHGVEAAAGPAALGRFTLALMLVQVPLTPISYAAPLLLRRWIERPGAAASRRLARAGFVALLLLAGGAWALSGIWPDLGLGDAYTGTARALAVLLAGGAAESAARLLAVHASASGMPWVAVRAEVARGAILALGWVLLAPSQVLSVAVLWAVAAAGSALVFAWHARTTAELRPGAR